jgi:hypothetical protein
MPCWPACLVGQHALLACLLCWLLACLPCWPACLVGLPALSVITTNTLVEVDAFGN